MTMPTEIKLHTESRELELVFGTEQYRLSYEMLRVLSPSAEVQGHGTPILQTGKRFVTIRDIEPVGNYAVKITFDDGHDSGLYSWSYLHKLCVEKEPLWQDYLEQLKQAGAKREPDMIGSWKPQ
ncbi:MAG: 1-(5-phosphoribosyl)-5-((5-phosphoribosylamino)methylideneamino)imidazole-4-carboxamide isomerase [Pseudomonadales bacterium]|jgi:DUF971 family protein|uniref:DUF971 domain-containing protein n=1 Tax=unclassified Ketobacter TaxID=2639109 RepID=UPI000C5C2C68|nr:MULTISPECIES: DUF971 domain-containing protein [unclassified Ketobacter]MAA58569.1 1-(5-phosphoribosyl)-5-((5-phosphoribosylamino)methylideneamino)imidazole-4-carboxamide isomerase [Pseudomonadales bacterium]MEC8811801.1 DUF971 domain-containing protein [Pseudomonadota bacterium]TNC84582.1 MAG: 1-(5-phosphoribosyl)-5-((5-phosphoribosylamino)methylideneamino)imidazole-4-carboxamide isomerase [Alcanivorax sp.]HAG96597.1 1-(5-phosphoribosyl)-5-((5-phosphoribosylamino)methylideneamino)imidazole-|tara:strand:+ start:40130 stop:40501 length:372 start_codon:yes stop_codon:yes gene_type:complete